MKKTLALLCLAPLALLADLDEVQKKFGALHAVKTNVTVVSNTELLRARKFFPVMRGEDGNLRNEGGIVADKITTDAIDTVAKGARQMADAANEAMQASLEYVNEAAKNMARDSIGIALAFAPENEPSNLTVYVAHESTDGTNDTFYIWMSEDLMLAPNLFMSYEYYGGSVTQKVNWSRGWNYKENITDGRGRVWEGCHYGTSQRPEWAINVTCVTSPNIPIGGPAGMNWGGITVLDADDMEPFFTGEITNSVLREVIRVEDGAIKEYFTYSDVPPNPEGE